MKVYGILEGVLESTYRYGDPGIHRFDVCESGFLSEGEAVQSLIDTGWTNDTPLYVKAAIGSDAWVRPEDEEREMGEDFRPVERVRYIFEMEVDA